MAARFTGQLADSLTTLLWWVGWGTPPADTQGPRGAEAWSLAMGRGGRGESDPLGRGGAPGAPSLDLLCRGVCGGAAGTSGRSERIQLDSGRSSHPCSGS